MIIVNKGTNLLDSVLTTDDYILRKINRDEDDKIAFDLAVSPHTLERWKTKVGVRRYHVNQKRYQIIMEMKAKGKDIYEIARKLHMTPRNCLYVIKQFSTE